ncbi:vacuolar membrane protein-domain-containing protein [Emericellopsis atlantica]|uniref:Vacuolar membrane protein-domain-containing protein n=1 Tax=Emericellopsis atlantica TaxID=2614577 RepID=A0A9P7ZSK9_9HYPO|nr:vacuolar membrane protein-domain-containing protein [Emericellopsis atlantica]KAG9257077.1 vacuolar membrane protein-domain-containing protein [Emericellopsis atlantica]
MQPPADVAAPILGVDPPSSTTTMLAAVAATVVSTASTITARMNFSADDSTPGECSLMGPFAILVQAALGALALLSLVFKRWRERPQRPVKIWFFDVSKQVFGSVLVHIANIFMSMLTSGRFSVAMEPVVAARTLMRRTREDDYTPNPCSFYLLNLAIDTTIGIPILIVLLKIVTGLVAYTPLGKPRESIQSGHYGQPPNAWWWLKQSVMYFIGLFGMKICVLIIFLVIPSISKVGDWALGWTEGNEKLQIAFVMMIFPLIMNALQYYIIDSFIKEKDGSSDGHQHDRLPSQDPEESNRFRRGGDRHAEGLLSDSEDEMEDEITKRGADAQLRTSGEGEEYDPDKDGDARTVVGSSSSNRAFESPDKPIAPALYPKE